LIVKQVTFVNVNHTWIPLNIYSPVPYHRINTSVQPVTPETPNKTMRRCGAVGSASYSSSSPIKGPRCFLEQETLLSLLSTGWFQERIRAW